MKKKYPNYLNKMHLAERKLTPEDRITIEEYLNFCEGRVKKAQTDLKASEVSIKQKLAELEDKKVTVEKKVELGAETLGELKQLYKKAAADDSWPVKYKDADRDEDFVKRSIMRLAKEVPGQQKVLASYETAIDKLKAQETRLMQTKDQLVTQLNEIDSNREMLKVNKVWRKLKPLE